MFVHTQSFEDLTAEAVEQARIDPEVEITAESEEELRVVMGENPAANEQKGASWTETKSKDEDISSEAWRSHRKHVFVLSEAGKPIYSRYGTEEALSSTMGVMMALVSVLEADKNIIRSIHAGQKIL